MTNIILPGYSAKNEAWAQELAASLSSVQKFEIIKWDHWYSPDAKFDIKQEAQKLVDKLSDQDNLVIIAKSIGTLVCVLALPHLKDKIKKLVFCGIPFLDFSGPEDSQAYQALADFPQEKLLVIQNSQDNHGTCAQVVEFLGSISPDIKVVEKDRSDHEYPYSEEIKEFLG